MYIRTRIYIYKNICVYVYMYIYIYAPMMPAPLLPSLRSAGSYTHVDIYTHGCTCIYTHVCMYTYV